MEHTNEWNFEKESSASYFASLSFNRSQPTPQPEVTAVALPEGTVAQEGVAEAPIGLSALAIAFGSVGALALFFPLSFLLAES